MEDKVKVNFSIPVNLFDYRESDNSLYSYAKLKIFYVGETPDRRVFTKSFSDKLIETLPYVPVVGYYDEEDEDFKGHHQSVQHIYGIVPEDTKIEYIEEDGKEFAVCDVILYTGRNDRTGEIAQKIVGKPHSLELNPKTTTYQVNRDGKGRVKNIEFETGSLLGLSILGDNEKPAFTGSGFFTEDSEYMRMFEGFKVELEKFTKAKQRGEIMVKDADMIMEVEEEITTDTSLITSVDELDDAELQTDDTLEEVEDTQGEITIDEFEDDVEDEIEEAEEADAIEEDAELDEEIEEDEEEDEFNEVLTREQRLAETFMKVTYDEVAEHVLSSFYTEYGENVYVIQWSPFDSLLVYLDFEDGSYNRVSFSEDEEKNVTFSEGVNVKLRFLTEEEIKIVFIEEESKEEVVTEEETEMGTEEFDVDSSSNNDDDGDEEEHEEFEEENEEEQEKFSSTALDNSEREELEAFRAEKKENLISSFSEDLSADFIKVLRSEIEEYTFDDLEIALSREFTRVSRQDRNITKPNTFVYMRPTSEVRTQEEQAKSLIERYKTQK